MVFGGLLLATVVVLWVSFPNDVRESFTTFQRLTVLVLGLMVLGIEHGLSRCRIDATPRGCTWSTATAATTTPGRRSWP